MADDEITLKVPDKIKPYLKKFITFIGKTWFIFFIILNVIFFYKIYSIMHVPDYPIDDPVDNFKNKMFTQMTSGETLTITINETIKGICEGIDAYFFKILITIAGIMIVRDGLLYLYSIKKHKNIKFLVDVVNDVFNIFIYFSVYMMIYLIAIR